jgi:hypothetical protein
MEFSETSLDDLLAFTPDILLFSAVDSSTRGSRPYIFVGPLSHARAQQVIEDVYLNTLLHISKA